MKSGTALSNPTATVEVLGRAQVSIQDLQSLIAKRCSKRLLGFIPVGEAYRAASAHLCFVSASAGFVIALTNDENGTVVEAIDLDDARWARFGHLVTEPMKQVVLARTSGEDMSGQIIRAHALHRGALEAVVCCRTINPLGKVITVPLLSIVLSADQIIDSDSVCALDALQVQATEDAIKAQLSDGPYRACGEIFVRATRRMLSVPQVFKGLATLEEGFQERRWVVKS